MKKPISLLIIATICLTLFPVTACKKGEEHRSSYDLVATYTEDNATLTARMEFCYYNDTDNEIKDLKFQLWGNAYRKDATFSPVSNAYLSKAYYDGKSYGEMTVENVSGCGGWNVGGEDENILTVNLLTPIYPEDNVTLTIDYTLKLANVEHRTGVAQNTVNLGNFYPVLCRYSKEGFVENVYTQCGDPFVSECADITLTLTYPHGYTAATSGKLLSESIASSNKVGKYKIERARDIAVVLSKKFQVATHRLGDVEVSYFYYDDASPQVTLNTALNCLGYFSKTFGAYPYPTLNVVQAGFCLGGMEYPALALISDGCDQSTRLYTVVHEIAHQWWYGVVGSDQVNDAWQDEGLAEYSTLMFFENTPEYGVTKTGMLGSATKAYRAYYTVYNQIFGNANTSMTRELKEFSSDYEYVNIAYNKGILLFDCVRGALGDEKFISALKEYYKENAFKIATKESLLASFVKRGDVEGILDAYLEGKIII